MGWMPCIGKSNDLAITDLSDGKVVLGYKLGKRILIWVILSAVFALTGFSLFSDTLYALGFSAVLSILAIFTNRNYIFDGKRKLLISGFRIMGVPAFRKYKIDENMKLRMEGRDEIHIGANLPVRVPVMRLSLVNTREDGRGAKWLIDKGSSGRAISEIATRISEKTGIPIDKPYINHCSPNSPRS